MSRKGENIFQRKDGRWEARYVKERLIDGKYKYGYCYGKSYLEAKTKRNEILLNLEKKKKESKVSKYTFAYYIENWLNSMKYQVKKSTYATYTRIVKNHIEPDLGNIKIVFLTSEVIEGYINQKFECGRIDNEGGLSDKTIRDIIVVLRQILSYAKLHIDFRLPKLKKKEIQILTKKDQTKLERFVLEENTTYSLGVFTCLYTGMRLGEICALKWKNINLAQRKIIITNTISRIENVERQGPNKTSIIIDNPKTEHSKREIPINRYLYACLKEKEEKDKEKYLLTGRTKYIEPRSYYRKYQRIIEESGIEKCGFHTLRHTFATRCIEIGMDPKTLSEILGHSDVKVTLSLYVHPSSKLKNKYMEKLNPYTYEK